LALPAAAASPLDTVRTSVRDELARGGRPIVVFNIDGTILDNSPRSLAILKDFVAENPGAAAEIADSVNALAPAEVDYYVIDTLQKCGLRNLFLLEAALRFWADNFFTARYTALDMPTQGAVDFIREIHDAGALIVYISGRNQETMLAGTVESLRASGFPVGTSRTLMILSPAGAEAARLFKRHAYGEITRMGKVVGAFDDEVEEVVTMKRHWPRAEVVFFKNPSLHIPGPADAGIGVINFF
jgi:hypothetical protein